MTITGSDIDTRVARGAALFDARYPGWAQRVDLDLLDVGDTQYCAAAQVVTNSADDTAYMGAMDELNIGIGHESTQHGFSLTIEEHLEFSRLHPDGNADKRARYASLTEAWHRAITARLNGADA